MIGKIKGTLSELDGNIGLVETSGGVFYQVFITPQVASSGHIPFSVEIYTYLQVRDDALVLFGFQTRKEYQLFTLLLTVSGVGPKTAFGVVSYCQMEELVQAIKENDVSYFSKVSGLGKKTAMKIILELSQKLKTEFNFQNMIVSEDDKTAVDALVSLGFKTNEAKNILAKLPKELSLEEKIKQGLQLGTKAGK